MRKSKLPPKPKIGTFIDPLSDYGFKFLFGREPCKDLLVDFLNEIFKGRKVIADLTYNKNERSGPGVKSRKMIFDLTCTGKDGEQFIIEVQRIRQDNFKDRAIFYSSRLIHDQPPQGDNWDYSLKEVYFIGIMPVRTAFSRAGILSLRKRIRANICIRCGWLMKNQVKNFIKNWAIFS